MLQHCGKVFFKVATIDRKKDSPTPTIYLDVIERSSSRFLGQIRYNHDPNYDKSPHGIRMAFDVVDPRLLDPSRSSSLLEDIIVGGMIWLTMDPHRTYDFRPKVYMSIHSYDADPDIMKIINQATLDILTKLECTKDESSDFWTFSKITPSAQEYISSIINRD